MWRAFAFDNFSLREGTRVRSIEVKPGDNGEAEALLVTTTDGETATFDFIISATGYRVDLSLRPEMRNFLPHIQLWSDQHSFATENPMGQCPYLGDGFQFLPKKQQHESEDAGAEVNPDPEEYIPRLFHFSTGARASHGVAGNQLSGIYAGLTRMSGRIATDITTENWDTFFEDFKGFENVEVTNVGRHRDDEPWYPQQPRY